jgi:hypothetical protein
VTGSFWDTYLLLVNPSPYAPANVTITFVRADGNLVTHNLTIPTQSRRTVSVDALPGIGDTTFRTQITSDISIVAERVTYWPGVVGSSLTGFSGGGETFRGGTPSGVGATPGEGASTNVGPYAASAPRFLGPHPYELVTEGEPGGDAERALAAQAPPPVPSEPTSTENGKGGKTNVTTSSTGWYGAHLTGRRP